jgi:hypothetical protein
LTLSTLPGATVGVPYTATIGVSGGTAPYTCLQTGGALPAGLSLSAACVVSGTPTTAGTSSVTVKATDSSTPAETVTGPESITVAAAPILVLSNPPGATVNTPYTGAIGVTGGTAPYTCVLITGPLPAGLTLGTNCIITGTPTAPGTYPVTVKATDTSTPVRTGTSVVTITVSPAALTLTLSTLPGATVGIPYTATIGVSGGIAPYTCIQAGGTLPPGLTISASCVVSGTPTTAGPYTVQVMATDSSNPAETVTGPESITVSASSSLVLSNPPGATVNTPYTGRHCALHLLVDNRTAAGWAYPGHELRHHRNTDRTRNIPHHRQGDRLRYARQDNHGDSHRYGLADSLDDHRIEPSQWDGRHSLFRNHRR